ncbi:MAG: carboxylating nicotinate-nucleotide diphosphorylase [Ginsengibacter sp.]
MNYEQQLDQLIKSALKEDIGEGDYSTLCCIAPDSKGKAILKVKENGILAGIETAKKIFTSVQPDIMFTSCNKDGEAIVIGDVAFKVEGNIPAILSCERLVLNIMQRMSGIATLTRQYVEKIKDFHAQILDTRKTTPNFRLLEKEAVRIGGGTNHRFGLYDMIMLKDNHIDYCGGIENAIIKARDYVTMNKKELKIEIETRNLEDVKTVMKVGKVDRIMLDNFSVEQLSEATKIINGNYETEASGGINLENIESYAATGVDYISCGAIIHHAISLDLSLKAALT